MAMAPTHVPAFAGPHCLAVRPASVRVPCARPRPTVASSAHSAPAPPPPPPPQPHHPPAQKLRRAARAKLRTAVGGAGDAFRTIQRQAAPRARELLHYARAGGPEGGSHGPGGWRGWRRGGGRGGGHNNNNDDDDNDDFNVDPSWGAAPGVHVVMRGRCDEAYRVAVANLLAFANTLPNGKELPAFLAGTGAPDPGVPLVIMLSWMGANAKSLARYKTFYESIGYEVHVVINGLKTAIFPPASKKQAELVAHVINSQPSDRPVFVHAFSIGTGIYGLFLDTIKHDLQRLESVKNKVVGVIFDSGPAPIFPHDVAKGLHAVCPMVSKAVWESCASAFFFLTQARKSFARGEHALANLQIPSPQLYFYSKDDKVIPNIHQAVEDFIENNKQRGIEVYRKFWEKSVHATHLKIHPDEYIANLERFVHRCMELRSDKLKTALSAP